jgi:Dyp-type peroxidase family
MSAPTDEPILELDDIQGNAIPGFLKDHQHYLFFRINDAAVARKSLRQLGVRLASSAAVLTAHRKRKEALKLGRVPETHYMFLNVALSARGLRKLTSAADVDQFADEAFKQGLSTERSLYIGDAPSKSAPPHASAWYFGGSSAAVDGVVIMASDDLALIEAETKTLIDELSARGISIVHQDVGDVRAAPKEGHEQFGFKDVISQPAIRGRWPNPPHDFVSLRTFPSDSSFNSVRADFASPGSRLVWPGHFLFGYPRQEAIDARASNPMDAPVGPPWAKNGSLMVYRRLQQNVEAFQRFVEAAAKALAKKHSSDAPDAERLAALLIGRWPSGTPLVRSPMKDIAMKEEGRNYFSYGEGQTPPLPGDSAKNQADPDGRLCPIGAHIRKVNARDQATDLGLADRTVARSILRRGVTYDSKDGDKGLLFVAYQSSIVEQFEFLMRQWIGRSDAPRGGVGEDPILTQGHDRLFQVPIGDKVEQISISGDFIVPTGGEYFFSPSISFFKTTLTATSGEPGEDAPAVAGKVADARASGGPGSRPCCALGQWIFGAPGSLDPTALAGHAYGGGGPVGYVYTASGGIADLGHIRDLADMTKFIYDSILAGCVTFKLYEGTAILNASPQNPLDLASAIAYVESWAHELTTWATLEDYSAFSPEDLPSNVIGIEIARRALGSGSAFNAAVDKALTDTLKGDLGARPKADTDAVLAKIKDKWFQTVVGAPPFALLRRNFDAIPWPAGMPYDSSAPSWLNSTRFSSQYSFFSYSINSPVNRKSGVTLATMAAATVDIRAKFVAAYPGKDRP